MKYNSKLSSQIDQAVVGREVASTSSIRQLWNMLLSLLLRLVGL